MKSVRVKQLKKNDLTAIKHPIINSGCHVPDTKFNNEYCPVCDYNLGDKFTGRIKDL